MTQTHTYTHTHQEYCLGFVFNKMEQVLLMTKDHPPNQRGMLNGIGGKIRLLANDPGQHGTAIEYAESPLAAMDRESGEELKTATPLHWKLAGVFHGQQYKVHVFAANYRLLIEAGEAEPVDWYSIHRLPDMAMYNLCWLVPLAQRVASGHPVYFDIGER